MTLQEKINTIKQLITMVCNVIPNIVEIIKLVISTIQDIKTS